MAKWQGKSLPQPDRKKPVPPPPPPESEQVARNQRAGKIRNDLRYEIESSLGKRTGGMERIKE